MGEKLHVVEYASLVMMYFAYVAKDVFYVYT